jgi:hypothetical protein
MNIKIPTIPRPKAVLPPRQPNPRSLPMGDLYRRLRTVGFDAAFIRTRVLPDWWDDSLAENPVNRTLAELAIFRFLGFSIRDLSTPSKRLKLPPISGARLKRLKGTKPSEIVPSILVAERIAKAVVHCLQGLPAWHALPQVGELRKQILTCRQFVDLEALLHYAWSRGIAVLHISALPKPSKRFSGMALFCGETPVIVLASRRDSPPWLAFHLAHELGHLAFGHVTQGKPLIADNDIDQIDNDEEETKADAFACELLTGAPSPQIGAITGLTAPKLASIVHKSGSESKIDPGTLALVYGHSAERMPVAQKALKLLGMDRGARPQIVAALTRHIAEEVPESEDRFLSLVTGD